MKMEKPENNSPVYENKPSFWHNLNNSFNSLKDMENLLVDSEATLSQDEKEGILDAINRIHKYLKDILTEIPARADELTQKTNLTRLESQELDDIKKAIENINKTLGIKDKPEDEIEQVIDESNEDQGEEVTDEDIEKIKKKREDYKKILDGLSEINSELKDEIELFIKENIEKLEKGLVFIKKTYEDKGIIDVVGKNKVEKLINSLKDTLKRKLDGKNIALNTLDTNTTKSETKDESIDKPIFQSYSEVIDAILKNEDHYARSVYSNNKNHKQMVFDLKKEIESIKSNKGKDEVQEFISKQKNKLEIIIKSIETEKGAETKNLEKYDRILKKLDDDIKLLEKLAKEIEVENTKNTSNTSKTESWQGFKTIDSKKILNSKEGVQSGISPKARKKLLDAIKTHNENILNKSSKKELEKSMMAVNDAEDKYKESLEDEIESRKIENQENEQSTKETEVLEETNLTEEEIKIFYLEDDTDYNEILNNKSFDFWLEDIEKIIKRKGDIRSEIKDLSGWYLEYQEFLPYIEKTNEILKDVSEKEGVKNTKTLATKEKISLLLYEIHTDGENAKQKIDTIYEEYKKSKELAKTKTELENELNHRKDLAKKSDSFNSRDIKKIMESWG